MTIAVDLGRKATKQTKQNFLHIGEHHLHHIIITTRSNETQKTNTLFTCQQ